jgi:hypothetical protein
MNPWRVLGWSLAVLLLLTPAVAMRFTDQVHWTLGDFVFAAVLLGTTGGAFELAARHSHDRAYRAGAGLTLLAVFLLVWINGAVGIIGSEREPANRLYAVVLLIAIGGALLARFRPAGLARTLFVTALAQAIRGSRRAGDGLGPLRADPPPRPPRADRGLRRPVHGRGPALPHRRPS